MYRYGTGELLGMNLLWYLYPLPYPWYPHPGILYQGSGQIQYTPYRTHSPYPYTHYPLRGTLYHTRGLRVLPHTLV